MMRAMRVLIGLMLWTASGHAAELNHMVNDRTIGARLEGLNYPDTLRKDLRSGLTNRVLIRVTLNELNKLQGTRAIEIAVKYDLWDETFSVVQRRDGTVVNDQVLKTLGEVLTYLRNLEMPNLFPVVADMGPLTLRAEALLNPIERERMEQIQKWVRENSSYVPLEGAAESTSNAMFNRIFEQYARNADAAAEWRETVASPVFSVPRP